MADENYKRLSCADFSIPLLISVQIGKRPAKREARNVKYQKKTAYTTKPCKRCSSEMRGTQKSLQSRTYCSKACHDREQRQRNTKNCEICQKQFHRRRGGTQINKGQPTRYCSNACKFVAQRLDQTEVARRLDEAARARAMRELAKAIGKVAKAKEPAAKYFCVDCRREHLPSKWHSRTVCAECIEKRSIARDAAYRKARAGSEARRADRSRSKAIRRARIRIKAEAFDPIKVLIRDKWHCQLCGVSTPKRLRGTYEEDAPELDHIVPLALGGSHTWANVQCACRSCNIRKGAKALGQMGLELSGGPSPTGIEGLYDTAPKGLF